MSHFSVSNSNDSLQMKLARWEKRKLRTCLYLNECNLCGGKITSGQRYYDGGYGRRAHDGCVQRLRDEITPTKTMLSYPGDEDIELKKPNVR